LSNKDQSILLLTKNLYLLSFFQ